MSSLRLALKLSMIEAPASASSSTKDNKDKKEGKFVDDFPDILPSSSAAIKKRKRKDEVSDESSKSSEDQSPRSRIYSEGKSIFVTFSYIFYIYIYNNYTQMISVETHRQ